MKTLITKKEVATLAFPASLDPEGTFVNESTIAAAQEKFLKPVFNGLYDSLDAYSELLNDYVKPALAQWVRFMILPSIAAQVGSTGIIAPRGHNFESVSPASAAALRARAKADARALTRRAVDYVEARAAQFPLYDPLNNVLNRVKSNGNVLL